MICIFTIKDDLHALIIQKKIRSSNQICHVIEVDQLWKNKIHVEFYPTCNTIVSREGSSVDIGEIKIIWWRRTSRGQNYTGLNIEDEQRIYMNQEFEAALIGSILTSFTGRWVSSPDCTYRASNKVLQYSLANQAGLLVPKTLVSQDPDKIRSFFEMNSFEIVVKPLTGSTRVPIFTHKLSATSLPADDCLSICPTQYQQFIPGTIHYRVNVFGEKIYAFRIEAEDIDWRQDLTVPVTFCEISEELIQSINALLNLLKIEMGIFDFKVSSEDNNIYFFEVNPQGNFLFLEGLTKFPIAEKFSDYLIEQITNQ